MVETLPLFPLGTVLLPGTPLPLHIFEARYRQLTTDLLTDAVPDRAFGVIATREGHEPGPEADDPTYAVGCRAVLHQAQQLPDGRFDIVAHGEQRFRLLGIDDTAAPYLVGRVTTEPDQDPDAEARARLPMLAQAARRAHRDYSEAAEPGRGAGRDPAERDSAGQHSQDEPDRLAYRLAADCLLSLADRQALLEQRDPAERLRMIRRLLVREAAFLRRLHAAPVPLSQLAAERTRN